MEKHCPRWHFVPFSPSDLLLLPWEGENNGDERKDKLVDSLEFRIIWNKNSFYND